MWPHKFHLQAVIKLQSFQEAGHMENSHAGVVAGRFHWKSPWLHLRKLCPPPVTDCPSGNWANAKEAIYLFKLAMS